VAVAGADSVQAIVDRLATRHPVLPRTTISRLANEEHNRFAGAPVQNYVPILVARAVETQLRAVDTVLTRDSS
jgi:hypothetical protein